MKIFLKVASSILPLLFLLPAMVGQGCPTMAPTVPTLNDLTANEKAAVAYAAKAAGALNQAVYSAQAATGDLLEANGQLLPNETNFGNCPRITKTGSLVDNEPLSLTVDFGEEPCVVYTSKDGTWQERCAGTATGTFHRQAKTIALQFNHLRCNDQSLDGSADLTYDVGTNIDLAGAWDLTWITTDYTSVTHGTGTCRYTPESKITTVTTFTGTVADNFGWSVQATMTNVQIAPALYGSRIPFSGTVTLSGSDIRTISITFTEASPKTGQVQLSLNGGKSFTVSLQEIDALLATLGAI